jgi:hypothetical protein
MLRRGPSNSFAAASAKARPAMACKFGTAARSSLSPSSYGELAIVFCSCTCDVSYHCAVVQMFGRSRGGTDYLLRRALTLAWVTGLSSCGRYRG